MRRVDCPQCGKVTEEVPWGHGKRTLTKTYMQYLAHWAKKMSWSEVARSFRTSWEKVYHSVEYVVSYGLKHRILEGIKSIGVDEIKYKYGPKYLTVVYQIDKNQKRLLWVAKDRTKKAFRGFFDQLGEAKSKLIEYICSDMWTAYLEVAKEKAPKAVRILDRFHIVQHLNKALDKVRAEEHRKMKADGCDPILTHSRWCLVKRPENLTEKQEAKLEDLLQYNLKSVRAYLLKEDFQGLWEYTSTAWAGYYFDRWCKRVMRSKIEPMKRAAKTLRKHRELILNWFRGKKQFSSGVVEGLNNKAKVVLRKSYGFRQFECAKIALFHSLGQLPEPPLTHRFY